MFAITAITGQVGGAVAETLLAAGHRVRAVVRDAVKGERWRARGCEVAVADAGDAAAMQAAFRDVAGVFVLLPPNFAPSAGFPEARATAAAFFTALQAAGVPRVVCLSTVGAHAAQENLLTQLQILEQTLDALTMPVAFLRPAWFMENALWDAASAADFGRVDSCLYPLDRRIAMVATADVGRVAAELLLQTWHGKKIVELEGPQRYSPDDIAAGFSVVLQKPVRAYGVARAEWQAIFTNQGSANPLPRMRMLDGFNEGWLAFEGAPATVLKGRIALDTVLRNLVLRTI